MSRCRWCGDVIACLEWAERKPQHPLPDWHQDACCTCASYLLDADLMQMTLDEVAV